MIESHVTNFELSRRLHELRVNRDSLFLWIDFGKCDLLCDISWYPSDYIKEPKQKFPAYLATELFEILPMEIKCTPYIDKEHYEIIYLDFGKINQKCTGYYCCYREKSGVICKGIEYMEDNICNALAKMLIYLIENGILKVVK